MPGMHSGMGGMPGGGLFGGVGAHPASTYPAKLLVQSVLLPANLVQQAVLLLGSAETRSQRARPMHAGGMPGGMPGGMNGRAGARQDPPLEHELPCSLEELYRGTTKRMKISRSVTDMSGRTERMTETLSIEIKPGWKKGTKVTFPKKGMPSASIGSFPVTWLAAVCWMTHDAKCLQ